MTAVPRLQLLPPPGSTPGATAVAVPGQDAPRVQPVVPAKAAQRGRQGFQQATIDATIDRRQARQQLANEGRSGQARIGRDGGQDQKSSAAVRSEATGGNLINFSRLTSMPFMVQVLGQQAGGGRSQAPTPETSLSGHRDAALLGSDIYRKAGGEPEILPDDATFVRLAV